MPLNLEDQERIAQTAYLQDVVKHSFGSEQWLRGISITLGRIERLLFVIAAAAVLGLAKQFF